MWPASLGRYLSAYVVLRYFSVADPKKSDKVTTTAVLHDNTATPRDDRRMRGQVLRDAVPFAKHAKWTPVKDRPDVLKLLQSSDSERIEGLLPIRYGRMVQSPFTFYRGSAGLMACDLANTPDIKTRVQACGDCHALNFGAFATPERNVVFDINDFDETLPAPWEWDVKRLTTSLVLLARDNELKDKVASTAVKAAVAAYRTKMEEFSRMAILDIWYANVDWQHVIAQAPDQELKKELQNNLKKAQKRTIAAHYFPKMTQEKGGSFEISEAPPLIYHVQDDKKFVERMTKGLEMYRASLQEDKRHLLERYRLVDIAIKVVGIGSVGTTCAVALLLAPDNEPLFLQLKEASASVLENYCGVSALENHGERVVAGQRIMQSASDIFLGWMKLDSGKHFYVRQLRDTKIKLEPDSWDDERLIAMSSVLGGVLARAHARSGDSAVISGYLGETDEFDNAIAQFSLAYADQAAKDHALLEAAVNSGKIKVDTEHR
jgi:uncharacterized protein (DUF2252 family)